MKSWFQIIRYKNLIILALTMCSTFFFYTHFSNNIAFSTANYVNFIGLLSSVVLIAAAGNLINDILDVEADKINKPDKVFIGNQIQAEDAIVVYWALNGIALLLLLYLTYVLQSFWLLFIPLLSIFGLWIYSKSLKKISFFGNLIIAILTGLVPLLVGVYIHIALDLSGDILNLDDLELAVDETIYQTIFMGKANGLIFFFALFAFLLNFTREWLKDIQDIAGDKLIGSQSLAIQLGEKKMKMYTGFFLMMTIGFLILILTNTPNYVQLLVLFFPIILVIISLLLSLYFLFSKKHHFIYRADFFLKISFLLGLIMPIWWAFL